MKSITTANVTMRPKAAAAYLSIGESTLWRRSKQEPDFPKPRKMGPRTTVFYTAELDAYLASLQPSGL
ncbi:helix-turn-helix transcriptional regulator [Burkholderia gladioli]|uniref:helix-turn-helix transcriptional regulator n=1 Tax=Burkholderia gladioli TaxID=28095 RepID=UPI001FC89C16|nr:AlpA family phage regulatory protein [Burkholderia gladioli]